MKKTAAKMKLRCIMVIWIALVSGTAAACSGKEITIKKIPEQIAILYEGSHTGTGVMIAPKWALTTAHNMVLTGEYTIRASSSRHKRGGSIHEIERIIKHPKYSTRNNGKFIVPNNNDIALIKVKTPVHTSRFARLPDNYQVTTEGMQASVSGWGRLGKSLVKPERLHRLDIPIVWRGNCGLHKGLQEGQICAGYLDKAAGPCLFDGGGPLTVRGTLIGLVSYGRAPTIFTEVSAFRNWIKEITEI